MDQLSSKSAELCSGNGHSASGGRGCSTGSGYRTGSTVRLGKAVQIVDFQRDNRAVLNEREVGRIIKEDLPTVVVSIGGVARSGKSFLLNLLVNLLTYMEKNGTLDEWERSNGPVQGVNWAQSRKAVTLGIWMWNKQFVIRRRDGKKVSVVLVGSQGTGDNRRSDVKLDTLIMYISLQLSTFQLLNIANYLTSNELTSLQVKRNLLMNKSEAELRMTLESTKELALKIFGAEGHQHKYGRSTIWSKYEDLFLSGCEEQEKILIVKYKQDKKIADLERESQEVKRKLEQQAIEAKQTQIRLEETKKSSEKREQANGAQLDKITKEMKTAREEDRAYYERESERYRESIKQEQEAWNRADEMYSNKMDGLNETIQTLNENMRKQESETEYQIQELQRELEEERNRSNDCSIL